MDRLCSALLSMIVHLQGRAIGATLPISEFVSPLLLCQCVHEAYDAALTIRCATLQLAAHLRSMNVSQCIRCFTVSACMSQVWINTHSLTPDASLSRMPNTAPVDPEAAAASPLLPWNTKVKRFIEIYSEYSDGLRGWGYLLNVLCVLTGLATGEIAFAP